MADIPEPADVEFIDSDAIEQIIQKNISKNIRDLRAFFSTNTFVTEKNDQRTNVINTSEKTTYNIPAEHIEEFFAILDTCRRENRMVHFSERQETAATQLTGIMLDFDRVQAARTPQILDKHFDLFTRHLAKLLRDTLDYDGIAVDDRFTFKIFYIRKPAVALLREASASEPALYKDGFHILIPEVQVSKGYKKYLISELISRKVLETVFKDIDNIQPASKMLDKMSASVPVHFFGNSKKAAPAYRLTHAYDITLYVDEDDIDRTALNVADLLADPKLNLTYEMSLGTYFPALSTGPTWLKKQHVPYKMSLESKIQVMVEKSTRGIFDDDELSRDDSVISLVNINNPRAKYLSRLLALLDIKFACEYAEWFRIMCAIAHTGISEDYKIVAREFSRRKPDSWSPSEFERVWGEAVAGATRKQPITIESIKYHARASSPAAYAELEKEHYGNILRKAAYDNEGRVEQATVSRILQAMCGDKFAVGVGINEKLNKHGYWWFEFVTPGQAMRKGEVYKWRNELNPDNLHLFIADHLPRVYQQTRDSIKDRKDNAADEAEAKYWASVDKNFKMSCVKLGNDGFQNGIIRQSQFRFRRRNFCEELDSYEDIIGVGNGVLKLGVEPELIQGFHEYKISKFTEVDYVPYDPSSPYIQTLEQAFRDIFPEPDVYQFMLFHASTGLDRHEAACLLAMLVGGGQNGKTFFAKMVHNALGNEYCAAGKPALLTSPFERGNEANSAQMHMRGKNWFYFDEFEKCETLNVARVKSIVNPGWQSGRENYGNQVNYKITCNSICFSNFDFIIPTTDHGTWRRIYYYKNKVKFCKNPDPNNPYEKMVNNKFIDVYANDSDYLEAMLSILVHNNQILRAKYGGDIKNVPVPTIMRETAEFRNRQDTLNRYITENIVKSPSADAISVATLANKYADWYNRNIKPTNHTIIDLQSQFENSSIASALERRATGMFLVGHRVKASPEEELEPGEQHITALGPAPEPVETAAAQPITIPVEEREIDPLSLTAPTHIQKTMVVDTVDALLEGLSADYIDI